jgi:hypothetical protein
MIVANRQMTEALARRSKAGRRRATSHREGDPGTPSGSDSRDPSVLAPHDLASLFSLLYERRLRR